MTQCVSPINKKTKHRDPITPKPVNEIKCNRCHKPSGWATNVVAHLRTGKELACKHCGNICIRILSNKPTEEKPVSDNSKHNKKKRIPAPQYVEDALFRLAHELEMAKNAYHRTMKYQAPVYNNLGKYVTKVFTLRATSWGSKRHLKSAPNFKYGKIKIWWSKWLGRDTEINMDVSETEFNKIIDICIDYVCEVERKPHRRYAN